MRPHDANTLLRFLRLYRFRAVTVALSDKTAQFFAANSLGLGWLRLVFQHREGRF
jgi:hypothetical protein